MRVLTHDGSCIIFFALINQSIQIVEYCWHIPCIDTVYPSHIPHFSLPSYTIEGWTLHTAIKSFCTLIKATYVFEGMKTRFYLENIFWVYTRYIPGISTGKVYTRKQLSGDSHGVSVLIPKITTNSIIDWTAKSILFSSQIHFPPFWALRGQLLPYHIGSTILKQSSIWVCDENCANCGWNILRCSFVHELQQQIFAHMISW